ncbi:NYN domain-containing protein [Lachnoclostridium sp. Marseille-P6806]|uniref:NYN domain-containing protein n=1 Tax=Lachnoclostridium sp. Marseille-P6806 TaxID=2364793 RepID=UPI001032481E|nr:NYN domain-containing protein [Lachnoclostridium sp. Marseille-P6806]
MSPAQNLRAGAGSIFRRAGAAPRRCDKVTVASSDAAEQIIIMGAGALRLSATGFLEEITRTREEMRGRYFS